jgi:hypothetical protein
MIFPSQTWYGSMKKLPPINSLIPNITFGILVFLIGTISWKFVLALQWLAYKILPNLLEQAVVVVGALAIFYYTAIVFQLANELANRSVGSIFPAKKPAATAAGSQPSDPAA